jgi:hypothetical protein
VDDSQSDFVWTFPCYILSGQYTSSPVTDFVIDEHLRYVAPYATGVGEQRVAIVTDSDLADEYRQLCNEPHKLARLGFPKPSHLKQYLELVQMNLRYAWVELNPKTHIGRLVLIQEAIPQLEDG